MRSKGYKASVSIWLYRQFNYLITLQGTCSMHLPKVFAKQKVQKTKHSMWQFFTGWVVVGESFLETFCDESHRLPDRILTVLYSGNLHDDFVRAFFPSLYQFFTVWIPTPFISGFSLHNWGCQSGGGLGMDYDKSFLSLLDLFELVRAGAFSTRPVFAFSVPLLLSQLQLNVA